MPTPSADVASKGMLLEEIASEESGAGASGECTDAKRPGAYICEAQAYTHLHELR